SVAEARLAYIEKVGSFGMARRGNDLIHCFRMPAPTSSVDGFIGAIGNTPLIRLRHLSDATGCEILGKAEFMNPGGSVKDRAALALSEEAERSGALRPGGTIVEGTAGN